MACVIDHKYIHNSAYYVTVKLGVGKVVNVSATVISFITVGKVKSQTPS